MNMQPTLINIKPKYFRQQTVNNNDQPESSTELPPVKPIYLSVINSEPSVKPIYLPEADHFCYLLHSLNPKFPNRTYIGYTVDLKNRLRKHNGELVGGAKYTTVGRPYYMVLYISGFPSKNVAMQFEWRMHHPNGKKGKRGRNRKTGLAGRYEVLEKVLNLTQWTANSPYCGLLQLTINWLIVDPPSLKTPGHYKINVLK